MNTIIRAAVALAMGLMVSLAYATEADAAQTHAHQAAQPPSPCEHIPSPHQDHAPAPCDSCDAGLVCCHGAALNLDMGASEGFSALFASMPSAPDAPNLLPFASLIDRPPRA
ncbi:MAG: hypothetical protein HY804_05095 [Nitrospinae bacterium]|nr:hypothetical protein [Nitrospinota bacterium]